MKTFGKIAWLFVSLIAALSCGIVIGLLHPSEKVNALWIVVAAACFYAISYRFYSAFIASKILALDARRLTPAMRLNDGIDYDPTNKWVLFGHHFAAIAGAGPLIGPMLAAQFGYCPASCGYSSAPPLPARCTTWCMLTASVRRNGRSLAQIAKDEIGPVGGFAASIAILFIIIVALAGLGLAVVNALKQQPVGHFHHRPDNSYRAPHGVLPAFPAARQSWRGERYRRHPASVRRRLADISSPDLRSVPYFNLSRKKSGLGPGDVRFYRVGPSGVDAAVSA